MHENTVVLTEQQLGRQSIPSSTNLYIQNLKIMRGPKSGTIGKRAISVDSIDSMITIFLPLNMEQY